MTTTLTTILQQLEVSNAKDIDVKALIKLLDEPQATCPCLTCRSRSAKRAEYRKREDVAARRSERAKARRAAKAAAKALETFTLETDPQPEPEPETETETPSEPVLVERSKQTRAPIARVESAAARRRRTAKDELDAEAKANA